MAKNCVQALITWVSEVLPGKIRLYAIGSEKMMVENYLVVSELTGERIMITGRDENVLIEGERLSICEMRKGQMVVSGSMKLVTFLRRRTGA